MLPLLSLAAFLALLALINRTRRGRAMTLEVALKGLPPCKPDFTPITGKALERARLAARLIRESVIAYNDQHPDTPVAVSTMVPIGLAVIGHEGGDTFLTNPPTDRRLPTGEPLFAGWWQIGYQFLSAYGLSTYAERLDPRKSTRGAVKQLIAEYHWLIARLPKDTPLSTLGGLVYIGHAQGPNEMKRVVNLVLKLLAPLGQAVFPDLQLFIGLLRARDQWRNMGNKPAGFVETANRLDYYHDHLGTFLPEVNVT